MQEIRSGLMPKRKRNGQEAAAVQVTAHDQSAFGRNALQTASHKAGHAAESGYLPN